MTMKKQMREATFEIEIGGAVSFGPVPWHSKGHGQGQPTNANLERVVLAYGKSLEIGGCNADISRAFGYIPYPTSARIVRVANRELMASWSAGSFRVW